MGYFIYILNIASD